jgi:hypothetical protein
MVLRRPVLHPDGTWKTVDEVVQRTVLTSEARALAGNVHV